jgi:hypothetical protein
MYPSSILGIQQMPFKGRLSPSSIFSCQCNFTVNLQARTLPGGWALGQLIAAVQRDRVTPWTRTWHEQHSRHHYSGMTWRCLSIAEYINFKRNFQHNDIINWSCGCAYKLSFSNTLVWNFCISGKYCLKLPIYIYIYIHTHTYIHRPVPVAVRSKA